jgi:hypothetical protein
MAQPARRFRKMSAAATKMQNDRRKRFMSQATCCPEARLSQGVLHDQGGGID